MKVGVYFCRCGGNMSNKVDIAAIRARVGRSAGSSGDPAGRPTDEVYFKDLDFPCSEDGQNAVLQDIQARKPDRVVVAGCSPREHESTFRALLARAGMNPYLLQMTNIREHVVWVTPDKAQATDKCALYILAAIERVKLHEPLETKYLDVNLDTLVIGAGPAGLKAALTLAEAGRKVVLVEKRPIIGGMPVLYEEVCPNLECGPCVLEPLMAELLQGPHAKDIELLTLSQVTEVLGFYGNFTVKIAKAPRYVNTRTCIGCSMCLPGCPASAPNAFNYGLNDRKAIAFAFMGGLPNAPYIDPTVCVRMKDGQDCAVCQASCPIEGTINFQDQPQDLERKVGAIVLATGGKLYDCTRLANLGFGRVKDVIHALQFERLASANGPSEGQLLTSAGTPAKRIAIVHCAGSLDSNHRKYCSAVCCSYAFKFSHLIRKKAPGAKVTHYVKTICVPGKEGHKLYDHARHDPETRFIRYTDIAHLSVQMAADGSTIITCTDAPPEYSARLFDLVVLCPPIVPGDDAAELGKLLGVTKDSEGFFEELHGLTEATKSKVRGVYLAGTCQAPMNLQQSFTQGAAAGGNILSALVAGRKLEIAPVVASVDPERCSGCLCCIPVCPYKAITRKDKGSAGLPAVAASKAEEPRAKYVAEINAVLCQGCGTCVSTCPAGAIKGSHFTNAQILAELKEVLS